MFVYELQDNGTVKQIRLNKPSDLLPTLNASKNAFGLSAQDIFDDANQSKDGIDALIGHESGFLVAPPQYKIGHVVCHFVAYMGWRMIYWDEVSKDEHIMAVTENGFEEVTEE